MLEGGALREGEIAPPNFTFLNVPTRFYLFLPRHKKHTADQNWFQHFYRKISKEKKNGKRKVIFNLILLYTTGLVLPFFLQIFLQNYKTALIHTCVTLLKFIAKIAEAEKN